MRHLNLEFGGNEEDDDTLKLILKLVPRVLESVK